MNSGNGWLAGVMCGKKSVLFLNSERRPAPLSQPRARPDVRGQSVERHLPHQRAHVLLEAASSHAVVPNDVRLEEGRTLLITGPNMGGKSTYIRMTALIAVMAQIGSWVPCTTAHLPVFDKVGGEIGAG